MEIDEWKGRVDTLKKIRANMEKDIEEQTLMIKTIEKLIKKLEKKNKKDAPVYTG